MIGLVPYPLKINSLEGLAERCTSVLKGGVAELESLHRDLRGGGDIGGIMEKASSCIANISAVEDYGLSPLQCQTKEMALLNEVLRGLHGEMELPFPRPAVCCTSNHHYAAHIPTNTIHTPIGESRSIQHFAHLYHELGHHMLHALDDPRLAPLREGLGRAAATIDEHYASPERGGTEGRDYPRTEDFAAWGNAQWSEWLTEAFCDLFGVLGGGPASAWAYLHMVAKKRLPIYGRGALVPQSHPPSDARMEMMCSGLRRTGFSEGADAIWARWRDVVGTVGGSPGAMYRCAVPEDLLRDIARIIHESLGGTSVVLYDPSSRVREGSRMRTLLNDAWGVFWRSGKGEFQRWEAAELDRLGGTAAHA